MAEKSWHWTRFAPDYVGGKDRLIEWLDAWEELLGGIEKIKITSDENGIWVFFKYWHAIGPTDRPTDEERESLYAVSY